MAEGKVLQHKSTPSPHVLVQVSELRTSVFLLSSSYERPPLLLCGSQGQAEIRIFRHEQNPGKMIPSLPPGKRGTPESGQLTRILSKTEDVGHPGEGSGETL